MALSSPHCWGKSPPISLPIRRSLTTCRASGCLVFRHPSGQIYFEVVLVVSKKSCFAIILGCVMALSGIGLTVSSRAENYSKLKKEAKVKAFLENLPVSCQQDF